MESEVDELSSGSDLADETAIEEDGA